jgi:hypothetical protein
MNLVKVIVKVKNDKGVVKFINWATSLENAIDNICKAENAPLNAIQYAKVAPLTIYDIKRLSEEKSPYFFSRKTLNFFKQKVSDFKVSRIGNDKFYIYANSFGNNVTERIFNPFTNELEHIPLNQ